MRIVITGAGGQLGREWIDNLAGRASGISGSEETADSLKDSPRIEVVGFTSGELDITSRDAVEKRLEEVLPSIVVNCAAWTDVDGAEDHPEKALKVNRDGVQNLAGWCKNNNALMVHYSTDYIFSGSRKDLVRYPDGYPEEAPADPINRYGESKRAGEVVLQESGAEHLLLRVSWLCGKYGSNFIKTMLRLAGERDRIDVVNDQVGSPSWADDVVNKSMALIASRNRGTFHLTSAGLISWYDLASELFRRAGLNIEAQPVTSDRFPAKAKRPAFSKLSTDKMSRKLGLAPEPWKKGLQRLLDQLNGAGRRSQ